MTNLVFTKAKKEGVYARVSLTGVEGSGKTWSALILATRMAEAADGRIAVIDTEQGSSSKYSKRFDFDMLRLGPKFAPSNYIAAINAAKDAGYPVLIIDSLSHAWSGTGGILDQKDHMHDGKGASYQDWSKLTPQQNDLIKAILTYPGHVLCCLRAKQQYEIVQGANGKPMPKKLGIGPIQRSDFMYEVDIGLDLSAGGIATIGKTRCEALPIDETYGRVDTELAEIILDWLKDAVPTEPEPEPPLNATQIRFLTRYAAIIGGETKADLDRYLKRTVVWPTTKAEWVELADEVAGADIPPV